VEHFRLEHDVGRFVGVLFGELYLKLEKSSFPWSPFDALDDRLPVQHVVLVQGCADPLVLLLLDLLQVFKQSALCGT
jgi:hypothetical protein